MSDKAVGSTIPAAVIVNSIGIIREVEEDEGWVGGGGGGQGACVCVCVCAHMYVCNSSAPSFQQQSDMMHARSMGMQPA